MFSKAGRLCASLFFVGISVVIVACGGHQAATVVPALQSSSEMRTNFSAPFAATRRAPGTFISSAVLPTLYARVETGQFRYEADDIIAYVQAYGIQTVFLDIPIRDLTLLAQQESISASKLNALMAVATVYLSVGKSDWVATPYNVPEAPRLVVRDIAPLYPKLAGILYDVEPQYYSGWNTARAATISQYLKFLNHMLARSTPPYTFGTTLVYAQSDWAGQVGGTGLPSPSMLQSIEQLKPVGGIVMEDPGNSASQQLIYSRTARTQLTVPFWLDASTLKIAGSNGYYGQTAQAYESNIQSLASQVAATSPTFQNVVAYQWDDVNDGLQTVVPQPQYSPSPLESAPLVPKTGAYLGVFTEPIPSAAPDASVVQLESQMGRTFALDMHYYQWPDHFPGKKEYADLAAGRVPIISWQCGAPNAAVASGSQDAIILAAATRFQQYGGPIFLRYMWEFNLRTNFKHRVACYDPATDLPHGVFSPQEYIAGWDHIRSIFASAGATNVIWLWNPSSGGEPLGDYYPGDAEVDWTGFDHYDISNAPFQKDFEATYYQLASYNKPIMLAETGTATTFQPQFFSQITSQMQSAFPDMKAMSYYDANAGRGSWTLDSGGIAAFAQLGQASYFSPMASVTPAPPMQVHPAARLEPSTPH